MRFIPFLISAFLIISCSKEEIQNRVKYEVLCDSCDLTYSNESEGTEQTSMYDSWTYEFTGEPGQFVYISAQNNNSSGTVKVIIWLDNNGDNVYNVYKQASSTGGYVIATASGSIP